MIYLLVFLIFSVISVVVFSITSWLSILNLIILFFISITLIFRYRFKGFFPYLFKIVYFAFSLIIFLIPLYGIYNINYQKDFSRNSIYSINNQLKQNALKITTPITVNLIKTLKTSDAVQRFYNKLKVIENNNLKFQIVSVEEQPILVNQKWKLKAGEQIYIENSIGRNDKVKELDQMELARAISRVNQDEIVQACLYLSDSLDIGDTSDSGFSKFKSILRDQGINLVTLDLVMINNKNCNLVIVPPLLNLSLDEVMQFAKLKKEISSWFFISDPSYGTLKALSKTFGFQVDPAIVIDQSPEAGVESLGWQILLAKVGEHVITSSINQQNPAVMLMANPVKFIEGETLLYSSSKSWGETNLEGLQQSPPVSSFGANDLPGSQPLLSITEKNNKMVIVGDIEWLRNSNINLAGNSNLTANIGRWLINDMQIFADDTPGIQVISTKSFNMQKLFFLIFCELIIIIGIFLCRRKY